MTKVEIEEAGEDRVRTALYAENGSAVDAEIRQEILAGRCVKAGYER